MIGFGCGQCLACRINRRNKWTGRLLLERALHKDALFVTLTYANEHLPSPPSVSKTHLQAFMKRLRKNSGKEIRFYACGEYGDEKGRPHYHLILFGLSFDDWQSIIKSWRFGLIDIGLAELKSMRYVAGYVSKKYVKHNENGLAKEFALMSRRPALGTGMLETFKEHAFLQFPYDVLKFFRVGGKNFPLDRLMREKLRKLVMTDDEIEHVKKLNIGVMQEQFEELILEKLGSIAFSFFKKEKLGLSHFKSSVSSLEAMRKLLGEAYEKAFYEEADNREHFLKIRQLRKDL